MQVRSQQAVAPMDGEGRQTTSDVHTDQPHSFKKFNFLVFVLLGFYKLFQKCDIKKKCKSDKLDPYVNSVEEISKELDIRRLIQRLLILERAVKCLIPSKLYQLLPYFKR